MRAMIAVLAAICVLTTLTACSPANPATSSAATRTAAGAILAALVVTLGGATAASASPPPGLAPPKGYYLALGDSIAYGFQTSKALAGLPSGDFNTGYAARFAAWLGQLRPQIATVNYSCPGESATSFLLPCIWKTSAHALHNDYPGSRLDAALAFLAAHRGQVSPVTVSLNRTTSMSSCTPKKVCRPAEPGVLPAGAGGKRGKLA